MLKLNRFSLKYQRFAPLGCKVMGIRKKGFVIIAHLISPHTDNTNSNEKITAIMYYLLFICLSSRII